MSRMPILVLMTLVLGWVPVTAWGQIGGSDKKKEGDPRVLELLEEAEMEYEVDEDGDFRLVNELDDERTHIVFINTATSQLGHLEIREVWSVGYIADGKLSHLIVKDLLEENALVKLGAWELDRFGGKEAAVFRAKIAAETDAETLLLTLHAVTSTADEKEEEITGTDDL